MKHRNKASYYLIKIFIMKGGEKMKMKKCNKGQQVLEYLLILAAVIVAIIAITAIVQNQVQTGLTSTANRIGNDMNRIATAP